MAGAAGGFGQSDTGLERHKRAKEIFGQAVDLAPADRERCLDAACADDALLRSEVEELIEADRAWSPGFLPGMRVGEYRILRQIGVGGMGAVYEAEQDAPRRSVALKLLRPEMADAEGRRRFAREGEVLGRLRHPGIAQVYSLEETPVGPAIVMEFVDGVPLDRFAGDLPIPRRVALVAAIGDAVEEAHRHGVIHRDLKPGNVLVTRDGQPKVLDFGLARSLDGAQDSMQTRVGRVMGTLAYMSPEQASGARDRIDTRTDVYSLGVMAFQLLTGRLPHDIEGRSLPGALRILQESDPPAAASIDRRLRGDLTVILAKALARDPVRRYQGVREFTEDLRRHLRREPILARPASALQRLGRFVRRNTAAVAAVAGVFLALGVGILLSIRFAHDSARKADRAHLQAADAAFHLRQRHIAREHLDAVRAGSRGWEWRYLDNQLDRALRFVPRGPGEHPWALTTRMFAYPITCDGGGGFTLSAGGVALPRVEGRLKSMSVSPDRRRVLVVLHGEVLVLDAASGETVLRFRSVRSLHKAAASPDGRIIAVVGTAPGIALHDAQTGRLLRFVDAHRDEVYSVAFDPSGRTIATGSRDARVEIREVETGRLLHALTESRLTAYDLAFSPDGSRIAAGAGDHSIYVWNVETGDLRSTLLGHDGAVVAVQFSGRDRLRSVGEDGYREWLVDFPDPRDHARHDTPPFPYVYDVRVSRDGRRVATIGWDRQLLLHDAASGEVLWTARTESIAEAASFGADADSVVVFERSRISEWRGGERMAHVPSSRYGYDLDTSPDGRTLCGAGESAKVLRWSLPGLKPLPGFVLPDRAGPRAVAWCPDRRAIAVGDRAGRCHLLDAGDGSVLWTARCADAAVWSLAFSPDGRQLAAGLATGEVRILDSRTGAGRAMLSGHQGAVYALSFLPDGSRLASGAHDKSIRLWDPRAATCTLTLDGHDWYVKGLAFALDGRVLVSGSGDGTVRWWSAERRRPER